MCLKILLRDDFGSWNESNMQDKDKKIIFYDVDLIETFCNYDNISCKIFPVGVKVGYRAVPKFKTCSLMYDTLGLVLIKVKIKWAKMKHSRKT